MTTTFSDGPSDDTSDDTRISDGRVTGAHDTPSAKLESRCATVRRRSNIQRAGDAVAAAKLLATRCSRWRP